MSGDEGAYFRVGIFVFDFVGLDDFESSLTIEAVLLFLGKCDPLDCGHSVMLRNHPSNTDPCVISVLSHQRN